MATYGIDRNSLTCEYFSYPTKQGDMLLIRVNVDLDLQPNDHLEFDGNSSITFASTFNCISTMTETKRIPGSDPVKYSHAIANTSITGDKDIIVTAPEEDRQEIVIDGETSTDTNKKLILEHFTFDAREELGAGIAPFIGWIALYSTKLDRYINYYTPNVGNYGTLVYSFNGEPRHQGFVTDATPSLMTMCTEGNCGIGVCTINIGAMIDSFFEYETVHETESICSKIFANRDPYNIDPEKPKDKDKPYQNSPDVSTHYGGGQGDFDYTSDDISEPKPPSIRYNHLGVAGVWTPSESQMLAVFKKIWEGGFTKALIDLFGNNSLMDGIISVKQMPFNIKSTSTATMALGTVSTGISVNVAGDQFKTIIYEGRVKGFTGDFYDYAPFMKIDIHLPFIGIVPLDVNVVMKKGIVVKYTIDISTGDTMCNVSVVIDGKLMPLFSYQTTVGYSIPVTAIDRRNETRNMASFAVSAMSGIAGMQEMPLSQAVTGTMAKGISGALTTGAELQRSGSLGGSPGTMDTYDVYLIYKCPNVGYNQKKHPGIKGNRATGYGKLSYYKGKGYVEAEFTNPHIDGCTSDEMNEIETLLKGGVYL